MLPCLLLHRCSVGVWKRLYKLTNEKVLLLLLSFWRRQQRVSVPWTVLYKPAKISNISLILQEKTVFPLFFWVLSTHWWLQISRFLKETPFLTQSVICTTSLIWWQLKVTKSGYQKCPHAQRETASSCKHLPSFLIKVGKKVFVQQTELELGLLVLLRWLGFLNVTDSLCVFSCTC